jgi:hypothetical protein
MLSKLFGFIVIRIQVIRIDELSNNKMSNNFNKDIKIKFPLI